MLDSNKILDKILKYFRITLANETDLLISKSKVNTIFKSNLSPCDSYHANKYKVGIVYIIYK